MLLDCRWFDDRLSWDHVRTITRDRNAEHQFRHARRVVVCVMCVCRYGRRTGPIEKWTEIRAHVIEDVAVEQPVSSAFRHPRHVKRMMRLHHFGYYQPSLSLTQMMGS